MQTPRPSRQANRRYFTYYVLILECPIASYVLPQAPPPLRATPILRLFIRTHASHSRTFAMIRFDEHAKKKTDKVEKRKNLGGFAKPLIIHRDQTTRITKRYYHAIPMIQ